MKRNKTCSKKVSPARARLIQLLKRDCCTARQVAKKLKCSRIHAYRRIKALTSQGVRVGSVMVREKATGPLARAFRIY